MVADKKMVEKHGKGNVTTYILTVMNMVREVILWNKSKNHSTSCVGWVTDIAVQFYWRKSQGLRRLASCVHIFSKIKIYTLTYFIGTLHFEILGHDVIVFVWFELFPQVSSLFKDGTIGSDINIVVVSLILLEQDPVSGWHYSLLYSGYFSLKISTLMILVMRNSRRKVFLIRLYHGYKKQD